MRRRIEADEYDSEEELRVADKARVHALRGDAYKTIRDIGGRPKRKIKFVKTKFSLGPNPAAVFDTNVLIDAQLIEGSTEQRSLIDMVDQKLLTMCIIPSIEREMYTQVNLHAAESGREISNWLLGVIAQAIVLPIVPGFHTSHVQLEDKSDVKFVEALYRLRNFQLSGMLVTSDRELLELANKDKNLRGAIARPRDYLKRFLG